MEGIRPSTSMVTPSRPRYSASPQALWDNSEPAADTGSSARWHPGSPNAHPTQLSAVTHPDTELLRRETFYFALHMREHITRAAASPQEPHVI